MSYVDEWLEDDKLMLLEAWSRDGYTRVQMAEMIGVRPATLSEWASKYEEIAKALKAGREVVDYKVENALLKSALGFTTKEIKVTIGKQIKNGQVIDIMKETTTKEIAPNVTACMAWLNNRRPDKWKRNRDRVIELEEEDNDLQITVVRGPKTNKNEDLQNVNTEVVFNKKSDVVEQQKTKEIEQLYSGHFTFSEVFTKQFYKSMQKRLLFVLFIDGRKIKGETAEAYLNNEGMTDEKEHLIYRYIKSKGYAIYNTKTHKSIKVPEDMLEYEYDEFIEKVKKQKL